jgi:hypothetical protein
VEIGPLLFTAVVSQLSGGQKTTRLSFTHGDYEPAPLVSLINYCSGLCWSWVEGNGYRLFS